MDNHKELLDQALDMIRELMKNGEHEGSCDNVGNESEEPCQVHLDTSRRRRQAAHNFLCKFPV
mgnify:CR=1 FL=1